MRTTPRLRLLAGVAGRLDVRLLTRLQRRVAQPAAPCHARADDLQQLRHDVHVEVHRLGAGAGTVAYHRSQPGSRRHRTRATTTEGVASMPTQLPSGRWRTRVRHPRTGKQLSTRAIIGGPETYATKAGAVAAEN